MTEEAPKVHGKCAECDVEILTRRHKNLNRRMFCSRACYREYMTKRYQRNVYSADDFVSLANYDSFLSQDKLPCLLKGCGWSGKHVTVHMNSAHGIRARDLKLIAGFNLQTGVISTALSKRLSGRPKVGVALKPEESYLKAAKETVRRTSNKYFSREAKEHHRQSRSLLMETVAGPERTCEGCQTVFQQNTPFGRARYCSIPCRDRAYSEMSRKRNPMKRLHDGKGRFQWVAAE